MTEQPVRIQVEPLERGLLEGVPMADASGHIRRPVDVGVLPVFSDERPLQGLAGFVDWRSSGMLSRLVRSGLCRGESSEAILLPGPGHLPARRLVLAGMGPTEAFDSERATAAARWMVRVVCGLIPGDVLVAMPVRLPERRAVEAVFTAMVSEIRLAESPQDLLREPVDEPKEEPAPEGAPLRLVPRRVWTWWIVAESRHVARLRRLLQGPPRPAEPN